MRVFLDFEASSLGKNSFPIEVAWVFEDGGSKSMLIRPLPEWTDWASEAESLHGISRARLETEGLDPAAVANQMITTLSGHSLFASAPSWDGKWLSALLRGGGLPRHALRLARSDDAFAQAAREILGDRVTDSEVAALVADVGAAIGAGTRIHRALADADLERQRLQAVVRAAHDLADGAARSRELLEPEKRHIDLDIEDETLSDPDEPDPLH